MLKLGMDFRPHLAIRWGAGARLCRPAQICPSVSFFEKGDDLASFARNDFLMALDEASLEAAKRGGYSGVKSFSFAPFAYEYEKTPPVTKAEVFLPEKALALFVGTTLSREVEIKPLFEAFSGVQDAYFLIAGAGPDKSFVKDAASCAGIMSRSRWESRIPNGAALLPLAKFALVPACGLAQAKYILESWLASKVPLAMDSPAARELVENKVNGFVVPGRDVYLIRKKIKEIIAMPEAELARMAHRGQAVAKSMTAKAVAPGFAAELQSLCGRFKAMDALPW
jgi:glycosyltransferase involved in cell wall biosynthesis